MTVLAFVPANTSSWARLVLRAPCAVRHIERAVLAIYDIQFTQVVSATSKLCRQPTMRYHGYVHDVTTILELWNAVVGCPLERKQHGESYSLLILVLRRDTPRQTDLARATSLAKKKIVI